MSTGYSSTRTRPTVSGGGTPTTPLAKVSDNNGTVAASPAPVIGTGHRIKTVPVKSVSMDSNTVTPPPRMAAVRKPAMPTTPKNNVLPRRNTLHVYGDNKTASDRNTAQDATR